MPVSTRDFESLCRVWLAGIYPAFQNRRPDWAVMMAVNWTMKETFVLEWDLLC